MKTVNLGAIILGLGAAVVLGSEAKSDQPINHGVPIVVQQAAPLDNDLVQNLVDSSKILRTLQDMEAAGDLSAELTEKPWSDSYWPLNRGMVAARYADPQFPYSTNWEQNHNYVLSFPAATLASQGNTDNLSPAEKYDLLMGDDGFTLTQRAWATGGAIPGVENWDGICDGWASAAISDPEPLHQVVVTTPKGLKITFYPSDIKGLASVLWAKREANTRLVGSHCVDRNPQRDDMGRIVDPTCFDSNPATMHMSLVNQLGQLQKPLIIDATYNYEIWNYPVWEYHYSYFNPQTLQPVDHWEDAVVPYAKFNLDRFKKYRAPGIQYLAGVSMSVTYNVEQVPTHSGGPHATNQTAHYIYDLELDQNKVIIGGEWYSNVHPDFIWIPEGKAQSVADAGLNPDDWDGIKPVPAAWQDAAKVASQRIQPLAVVVDKLVALSHASP